MSCPVRVSKIDADPDPSSNQTPVTGAAIRATEASILTGGADCAPEVSWRASAMINEFAVASRKHVATELGLEFRL